MAVILKLLMCKQGITGPTAGATLDLIPPGTSAKGWLVKNLIFYNHGTSDLKVDLMVKVGSGSYQMLSKGALTVPAGTAATKVPGVFEREITLDLNTPEILAAILSCTGAALSADCIINGIERDQ